jgi:Fic family protein
LDNETVELLIRAHKQLALLENIAVHIPNINLFVSVYVRKEALISSQIEGTQATLEDIFDPMIDENINRNVADVVSYVKVTEFAIGRLKELPLCNRLIKKTHAILMKNVRGQEKSPGTFRHSQNWIGGVGSTIKSAWYVPPTPVDTTIAMSHINTDDDLDVLIRAALIQYQFETIHSSLMITVVWDDF